MPELQRRSTEGRSSASAELLRTALVERLRDQGVVRSDRVADAFSTVPRHLFVPGEPLEAAYADDVVDHQEG